VPASAAEVRLRRGRSFPRRRLPERHSRLSRKIHRHKFPAQKFRKRRCRDHGRIVGGKRARRKKYRKPLHPRLALKRGPQLPIRGNAAAYEESLNLILARRRQRLYDQIIHHCALERSRQIESLPVTEPERVLQRWLLYAPKRPAAILNRSLHILRFDIAQNRRLNSAVRKIEVRPVLFGTKLPNFLLIAKLLIAPVRMFDLRHLKLDPVRIAMRREPVDDWPSRVAQIPKA